MPRNASLFGIFYLEDNKSSEIFSEDLLIYKIQWKKHWKFVIIQSRYLKKEVHAEEREDPMKIEQFVMAYRVEQDRLRALLPEGFISLRPVLRINAEVIDHQRAYLEFNTAVAHEKKRGWLNIGFWEDVFLEKKDRTTLFQTEHLKISFTRAGVKGACPAEQDNAGCFFLQKGKLRLPERITAEKEFCDCTFRWDFSGKGASGKSIGKTLPAIPTDPVQSYPHIAFTVANAAVIPCECVLGTYVVEFEREKIPPKPDNFFKKQDCNKKENMV